MRAAQKDHCVTCHMRSGPATSPPQVSITDHWIQKRPPPIRPGSDPPARLLSWPDLVGEPAHGDDLAAIEAIAYANAGQRAEAEKRAASVSGSGLRVPKFYDALAGHYSTTGQPWNAARAYTALLHVEPDAQEGLRGYARVMLDRGAAGAPEAMHALDRLLALDPEDPAALEMKAVSLFRSGRIDEARPLFAHAAAVGPSSGASHVALAVLARREGRDGEAIQELESARRIEPGDSWILERLHEAYVKAGDAPRAGDIERARAHFAARQGKAPTDATRWLPESWR